MRKLLLLALVALLGGCLRNETPPPIAAGMSVSIGNEEWPPRLARAFPPGTTEARLVTALSAQGFVIDLEKKTAEAEWYAGVCLHNVGVVWQTGDAGGKLVSVGGRYFPSCP